MMETVKTMIVQMKVVLPMTKMIPCGIVLIPNQCWMIATMTTVKTATTTIVQTTTAWMMSKKKKTRTTI